MTIQISKTSITSGVLAIVFFATILLIPSMASAQSATFTSEADCNARLSKKKKTNLKKYGEDRYKNRAGVLGNLDKKIDTYYAKFDTKIDRYEKSYKKITGKESGVNVAYLTTNKKFLKKEVADSSKKLEEYNAAFKKANDVLGNDSTDSAKQVCAMIYQLRVNSYLKGKVKWQSSIDSNRTIATVNKIRKMETQATYDKNKSRYKNTSSAKNISDRLDKVDTYQFDARFDKITRETFAITADKINSATPPKAIEEFKNLVPDAKALFADVRSQTGTLSDIRKDLKKEKRNPARSSRTNTTGGTKAP